MLFDSQSKFSENQAITATTTSQNIVNMGAGEVVFGTPKPLVIQVSEDFNNLTSLTVDIETASDEAFTSPVKLQSSTANLGDLKTGFTFPITVLPKGDKGYMRLKYNVEGTTAPTTGKITAGIVAASSQSWQDI